MTQNIPLIPYQRGDSPSSVARRWAAGLAISPFGVRIGVRTDEAQLDSAIRSLLLPNWQCETDPEVDHLYSIQADGPAAGRGRHALYLGSEQIDSANDARDLLDTLRQSMHLVIGAYAKDHVFVHAGAVAWRGKGILLPGRTHAGKSTLVKAMLDAGATYYSDEFAVIDRSGRVVSYPRALTLRREGREPKRYRARDLAWDASLPAIPVGAVLATKFLEGTEWTAQKQTPGEAVLELFGNTVSARTNTEHAVEVLVQVARSALCLCGPRGEAAPTADRMLRTLDQSWGFR